MSCPIPCALVARLLLSLLLLAPSAQAHRLSDACLSMTANGPTLAGRLDIPLRDLNEIVPLDRNADGAVTWGELKSRAGEIERLVKDQVRFDQAGRVLHPMLDGLRVADIAGEPAASVAFTTPWEPSSSLTVDYHLLFETDPQHRGLLRWSDGNEVSTFVFSPERPRFVYTPVSLPQATPPTRSFLHFVGEGVHHIWIGHDHILFLLALLLPSVVALTVDRSQTEGLRPIALRVLKVVTAFTLAHSLTLALAASGWLRLPSRIVETTIALSVAVAAVNNLIPFVRDRGWAVAFGFGLIHGFGFAGVLADLELPRAAFASALVGFNLGVELGQLGIVAVFLPVAYFLRESWFYRRVALQFGSVLIVVASLIWVAERGLGWTL
ncbi:MAG: HupE/UreJ family protein [Verrucomicrobiales bacterium]|nr:HupE/UreJ family protein [Verrucomicrobiales bacterium]